MNTTNIDLQRSAIRALAESLDIPASAYQLAIDRYEAIGEHLKRKGSAVARFAPHIYAQGSFQLGTMVRPLDRANGYDLDLACELTAQRKSALSQRELKLLVGNEVRAHAEAHGMNPPREKRRCWHLEYQDDVQFHADIVPALPEDDATKEAIAASVAPDLVDLVGFSVAITDQKHPNYGTVTPIWPTSNPRGYAAWFASRMRAAATRLIEARAERRRIDDIPFYEWKTPLQEAVQILKQHRNEMFRGARDDAPISCILTTLAAMAYNGELDVRDALVSVVEGMPRFVNPGRPRVPNPVNPAEDFADKWVEKPRREKAFWDWHAQLQRDIEQLGAAMAAGQVARHFAERFGVELASDKAASIAGELTVPAVAPSVRIAHRPNPWGARG